jgi:hypothetical protein
MDVNSRYPVRHNVSSWRERRACCDFLNQGHRLSPLPPKEQTTPNYLLNHARSGSDTRTVSTSPVRTQSRRSEPVLFCSRLGAIFMRFSGPQAQTDTRDSPEQAMVCTKHREIDWAARSTFTGGVRSSNHDQGCDRRDAWVGLRFLT